MKLIKVIGLKFTSSLTGESIFMPAYGYKTENWTPEYNVDGYYWSRKLAWNGNANCLGGSRAEMNISRFCGLQIRPVLDKEKILNSLKNNKNGNDENFWLF